VGLHGGLQCGVARGAAVWGCTEGCSVGLHGGLQCGVARGAAVWGCTGGSQAIFVINCIHKMFLRTSDCGGYCHVSLRGVYWNTEVLRVSDLG